MKKIHTHYLISLLILLCANLVSGQNLVINEILTSNTSINTDEDGSYQDWVELYNNGSSSINLNGYGLSDDPAVLNKWVFPNVSIGAGQYLLIWCSDKNRTTPGSALHTNFKISSSGETILLSNASGVVVSSVPPTVLVPDISYGRLPNGTGPYVFFETPTPNAVNASTGYTGVLNPPVFSQNSGFLPSAFNLTLSSTDSGVTILYTLDGSDPDANNLGGTTYSHKNQYTELPGQPTGPLLNKNFRTLQYSAPLNIIDRTSQPNKVSAISSTYSFDPSYYFPDNPVFKGTVVRAKVIKSGFISSKIITKTYFITPLGSTKYTLPVVSVSINEDRFFDYDDGIFVAGKDFDDWRAANPNGSARAGDAGNYYREGIESERQGNISYFVNGSEKISQEVGFRIRGGSSRRYENKSLSVFARSDYGDDDLDYKFFTDLPYTSFDRLTLSNSGTDFRKTMFKDALGHTICKELYPEKEAYQPTIAFLNGEFWGIYNIRERYDNNYFKRVYNTDDVDFLEYNGSPQEGDAVHYNAMMTYLETNSLSSTANFDYIKTQLDPESFSDYFIAEIFLQNSDWPNNNIHYWRNRVAYNAAAPYGLDGRWRWMFHDLDSTFAVDTHDFNYNTLAIATSVDENGVNPAWSTLILRRLLENTTYKNDFINRFADLLNTSFLSTRIISIINGMSAVIAPEMPGHITRWSFPVSMDEWNEDLTYEKDFANARPALQRNHIRSKFSISSNINATLNVSDASHGYIKINTINILDGTPGISGNPYPWTGIYFHNIPVKLKAVPKTGYIFDHWSGASTSTNAEITITPTGNYSITAHFVPQSSGTSVPIYFWMMDSNITNNAPLETLNSTYEFSSNGVIQYQSSLAGYPFTVSDPNWRKASMERRNNPTSINYRPEANGNAAYDANVMRGLQIKQPFQNGGLENTMVFNFSTAGYSNIKFSFAAVDELAGITGITVDYAVNSGTPNWITTGLTSSSLPLTDTYQLFQIDFTSITTANNNANFKVRLRFTGSNLTLDNGNRVTFNNFAVEGTVLPATFNVSYTSPNVFTKGSAITNLTPTASGPVLSYSVAPSLPTGLSLNTSTGVISGTPTTVAPMATYVVTATHSGGSANANVVITVNDVAPSSLSYSSPNVYTKGSAITPLNPSVSGGTVITYAVSPPLPQGITLNPSTGVISGTPTETAGMTTYQVSASNSGGSDNADVVITVDSPLGVIFNDLEKLIIYPNPFLEMVNVSKYTGDVYYQVYAIDGKILKNGMISNYRINLSELPGGLYFLHLKLEGQIKTIKLIKE
ncbi:CotH kinase family protein [Flavobacterium sp. GT3R68]|uniref:CotH kinase family protein n=1 Tax=Flavobacterium sp. GT3R68 TaxID=2594437 RepID=UPI000F86BD17|nr:CotH kinase family protein [Flavobacterium sp. GT3R68]RTY95910.1 T9SS type A sorting domain-containing protein [Flavobacterium sp. GSN2]TRW93682.1 T9SS type A sorting domain-containing protein [Flavobacterium sp. GT3R68]